MQDTNNTNNSAYTGLSASEVEYRNLNNLRNIQVQKISKSYSDIIKDNCFTLFNLINIILAAFIISIASWQNLLFMGVIFSNIVIGIFQEVRAKRILDKLSLITQAKCRVIRDNVMCEVAIDDIVIDDIVILESGNQIIADSIIFEGKVEVNESLLTGESDVQNKTKDDLLYSGSFIVSGKAFTKVIHVGEDNYASTILSDTKIYKKHKSQLRDSINFIIKMVGFVIIPMGFLLFIKQYFISDYSYPESIIGVVAALLGMVPEGLVLLISVALAVGTINLARKKTLVQELYCIETLARVDMLCLDKTGTLTQGIMRVENSIPYNISKEALLKHLSIMYQYIEDDNATSIAIKEIVNHLDIDEELIENIPFSSERKYSALSLKNNGSYIIGAYEYIFKQSDPSILNQIKAETKNGYRVLALAHSPNPIKKDVLPPDFTLLGLILLSDPIRKEAPQTLDYFRTQDVAIKIISGDDPLTVYEVAKKANVHNCQAWIDMQKVEDYEIVDVVQKYTVFGRVSPKQKKLLIQSLNKLGHTTAMIGDGINDCMALKVADCSISVAQGSEAAKSIANLVLLDNNFARLPDIVNEGRRVINNIQRASSIFLVKTTFSTIISFLTLFILNKYPFAPIQLTLISTLTIGIPSFFLALEANHNKVEGNFLINVFSKALPGALCVVASILYIHYLKYFIPISEAQQMTASVILTGTTCLFVLYRVSMPFSKKRFFLCLSMSVLFILFVIIGKNLFSLVELPLILLTMTLIGMCAIPFILSSTLFIAHKFNLKERILKLAKIEQS